MNLINFLTLERLEDNIFRGESRNLGTPQVFGGQVLGQALGAAQQTVSEREAHSIHAYFLRRGDFNAPIIYQVDRNRDGGSFSSRTVVAIQHGQPIFTMSASFQRSESGLEFYPELEEMPPAPSPDDAGVERAYNNRNEAMQKPEFGFCVSLADPYALSVSDKQRSRWWFKTREQLADDQALHKAVLAYISDGGLLATAVKPHGYHPWEQQKKRRDLLMASIDHAIWYHRPFRADEWLLYDSHSMSTSNSRGLARASIYDATGRLIASCMQEGLVRIKRETDGSAQVR